MANAKKRYINRIGSFAFIIGVVISLLVGVLSKQLNDVIIAILFFIGLIAGLLNITTEETSQFLIAAVALVIVTAFGRDIMGVVPEIGRMLEAIMIMVVPATVIVALRTVYKLAKN